MACGLGPAMLGLPGLPAPATLLESQQPGVVSAMTSASRLLYRLLIVASVVNLVGLPFAVAQAEPWHATLHASLALAGGFWALRLRHRRTGGDDLAGPEQLDLPDDEGPRGINAGDQAALNDQWLKRRPVSEREERK